MTNYKNRLIAHHDMANTYSITAYDPSTGQVGVAVQTHQMSVGRVVPWVRPGVGAVATQAMSNISFGPRGLALMAEGVSPEEALKIMTDDDPESSRRQVAMTSVTGQSAAFTGSDCIIYAGHYVGEGFTVQANMMTNDTVIQAMREAYEAADGDLAAQMMAAMEAAQAEDGDIRGMQSAALMIAPKGDDDTPEWATLYDLRVDEHDNPVQELGRLVRMRRAQWVNAAGGEALERGEKEEALHLWRDARKMSPEQEEIAFWQAVELADIGNDPQAAAAIFNEAFEKDERRVHWLDLIKRLPAASLIQREGAADELLNAIHGEL